MKSKRFATSLRIALLALATGLLLAPGPPGGLPRALAEPAPECTPGQDCNNDGEDDCTQLVDTLFANGNPSSGDVGFRGPVAQDVQLDDIAILRGFSVFYTALPSGSAGPFL